MSTVRGEPEETIGARLRRLRLERGLSQRALASPGVSYAYISRLEADARTPSVKALRQLAPKLGVSVEYLETGSELRAEDERELRFAEAELKLRLGEEPREAEQTFRALLAEAEHAGDPEDVLRAQLGLGEACARQGDFAAAIPQLEAARASASLSPLIHADLYATLARAYAATGRADQAVELLEWCLATVRSEAPDDHGSDVRFSTYLSYALSDFGELGQARTLLRETLDRSEATADPYTRVRLYWSLARLALLEGKPRVARRQIQRAIGLLEATEDTRQLARAHLSYGEILLDEGEPAAAESHLELAERLLGEGADAADLGWLWSEQARQRSRAGEHERAIELAQRALAILREAEALKRARAYAALAEAHAEEIEAAAPYVAQGLELFETARFWREAAALARSWGSALRRAGREEEALEALDRAASYPVHDAAPAPRFF